MGLLGKAIAINNANFAGTSDLVGGLADDLQALVVDFHRKNSLFHGIVFSGVSPDINGMLDGHGAVCSDLPGGNCLALLPGGLDRELFAHLLSHSSGLPVLSQFSAHSVSPAFEALGIGMIG
ncbi:MAG: hypothetical protein LBH20_08555 [Treponema sp.]|jgi:hypothetical protein|nr:hypothetical protein [Treponema sp.]